MDGRARLSDLAQRVGMSAPSVAERVRRLEEAGVITGYAARVDPSAMGMPITAHIRVRPSPGKLREAAEILQNLPQISECDRVTGEDCFLAKAHVGTMSELEAVIDAILPVASTNTSIVQSSPVPPRLPYAAERR